MGEVRTALIIGGGIGGLAASIALKQRGIRAEIAEINPAWSVYGVGIIQPSNALRALATIGLGEKCLQAGCGFSTWQMCDAEGVQFMEVPNENVAGPGYPPINGITRPALHKILTETTRAAGTRVRLGVTVLEWRDHGGHVQVQFSDGSQGAYDVVVVADGAHSTTRSKVLSDNRQPLFTGESVWRHNFPRPREMTEGSLYYGHKSKAGLVPMSQSLMYLLLVTPEPGNPRMPKQELHTLMRDRLAEYGGIVGRLREQITDPGAVVYRPMETLLLDPPWHRGRIVLIGDAAHAGTPHLAQGAAMALEDAVLLAELLSEQADLDATLEAFAKRRFPRCELVMKAGLQMGEWEMQEWGGAPSQEADHGGLMARSLAQLMRPF